MLKAVKIRLYPNTTQEVYIGKLLGCYRVVYNNCLATKKEAYEKQGNNLGLKELGKYFHGDLTKDENRQWLNEHNTKVLKQAIHNLLDAYGNFFKQKSGFPKFKSKYDNELTCRFPLEAISKTNDYLSGKITLTKNLKGLKFKTSDKYSKYLDKYKDGIRSATLTKTKSGKYFLSILVNSDEVIESKKSSNTIGIDLGIKDFVITSEGQVFENIKTIRNNTLRLRKLNRQLSKKKKGSKNKEKARRRLAVFHEKLSNKKENYLHFVANSLLDENQVIVMENLNVKGMMKNHNLAKSIQELSLGRFKSILKYKSEWLNKTVIEIDRFYPSSKLCSVCGYKYKELSLSEREWTCPHCGEIHNRDLNAAINILNEGMRIIGCRSAEFTLVDYPTMDDPSGNGLLKSSGRLKQEEYLANTMDRNFHIIQ